MATKPVFISYARANLTLVKRLKQDLHALDIPLWIDHERLQPGTPNWRSAIEQGIQSSQAVIYVASSHAKASDYVTDELGRATYYRVPIIPFWVEGTHWLEAAPLGMGQIQYIDARANYSVAFAQLAQRLQTSSTSIPSTFPSAAAPARSETKTRGALGMLLRLVIGALVGGFLGLFAGFLIGGATGDIIASILGAHGATHESTIALGTRIGALIGIILGVSIGSATVARAGLGPLLKFLLSTSRRR